MDNLYFFIGLLVVMLLVSCRTDITPETYKDGSYWIDGYFRQERVVTPEPGSETVRAMIDGRWQEFELQSFPDSFLQWNIARRISMLDGFRRRERPELAGPHNGVVATYGIRRGDTQFKLNNAVKGMGYMPRIEKLPEILEILNSTMDDELDKKLDVLQDFYEKVEEYFDMDKQVSLELYPTPEFETQTFLNQMTNPISTIVFLDIPSFKLKTIVRLLHPDDPELTEYERMIVRYVNDVYKYFHGDRGKDFITTVYYVVEVYDSSPGRPDARGLRINSGD